MTMYAIMVTLNLIFYRWYLLGILGVLEHLVYMIVVCVCSLSRVGRIVCNPSLSLRSASQTFLCLFCPFPVLCNYTVRASAPNLSKPRNTSTCTSTSTGTHKILSPRLSTTCTGTALRLSIHPFLIPHPTRYNKI